MEKIGEPLAVELQVFAVWDNQHQPLGYQVGIFGPARTPNSRTLYMNALHPDNISPAKERIFADAEAALAAWQAGTPRPIDDNLARRHGIRLAERTIINEQGLYRDRAP